MPSFRRFCFSVYSEKQLCWLKWPSYSFLHFHLILFQMEKVGWASLLFFSAALEKETHTFTQLLHSRLLTNLSVTSPDLSSLNYTAPAHQSPSFSNTISKLTVNVTKYCGRGLLILWFSRHRKVKVQKKKKNPSAAEDSLSPSRILQKDIYLLSQWPEPRSLSWRLYHLIIASIVNCTAGLWFESNMRYATWTLTG